MQLHCLRGTVTGHVHKQLFPCISSLVPLIGSLHAVVASRAGPGWSVNTVQQAVCAAGKSQGAMLYATAAGTSS